MRLSLYINQHSNLYDYVLSFLAGLLAIILSLLILPNHFIVMTTFLTGFSLFTVIERRLAKNREMIWRIGQTPWMANYDLAVSILILFLGTFSAFILYYLFFNQLRSPKYGTIQKLFQNQFTPLFFFNLKILLAGYFLSLFYRHKGLLLVIVWNSIHWAESFSSMIKHVFRSSENTFDFLKILVVMPHLVFEVSAFIMACLSGIFLSLAFQKYNWKTAAFLRVSRACVTILIVSLLLLALATLLEIQLAQDVVRQLLN